MIHGYSYEHWLFPRAFDISFCILYVDPWFCSMQGIQTIGSRIISSMILQILIQGNPSRWEAQIKMLLLLTRKIHNHHASRPLAQKHHVIRLWPNVLFERIHLFKIAFLSMLCLSSSLRISLQIEKKMLNPEYLIVRIFCLQCLTHHIVFVNLYSINMLSMNLFYWFCTFVMS